MPRLCDRRTKLVRCLIRVVALVNESEDTVGHVEVVDLFEIAALRSLRLIGQGLDAVFASV